ncbi:hypothetical protein AZO1586R_862 [Bathymodiolus azoricus thioautotrophic gill symbiont]|uniref:Uncharacterized protein n=1 Tax=Bathymodiolus azoricus thioautotrophic gill symbiont TaxID=235205 RepID=A0ACA8ZQB0_9GAMM|nr:hypothetical protein AZO1586R_862 [Bathymodiolus azoricus thioautotrophic gill symbiont]
MKTSDKKTVVCVFSRPLKTHSKPNQNHPFFQPSKSTKLLFIQHHKKP